MTDLYDDTAPGFDDAELADETPVEDWRWDHGITAKEVKKRWDKGSKWLAETRRQAAINDRFLRNDHWIFHNAATDRLEELPRNDERFRATINKIGPDSGRLLARLTARPLRFERPPKTADDVAIRSAHIAVAALDEESGRAGWEDLRYDHARAAWCAGVSGLCVEWDRTAGELIATDETGMPVATGQPKVSVVSVAEMAFEPGTRDAEKSLWWCRAVGIPPAEAQAMFNLEEKPAADARPSDKLWVSASTSSSNDADLTMVYTYFERPHGNRKGIILTVIGDEIVWEAGWYFPRSDRLNIHLGNVDRRHESWVGHTWCSDAVPIQTAYNASWSGILEHVKQASQARIKTPEGSIEDEEDVSDTPGEFLRFRPINGEGPQWMDPPQLSSWIIQNPDRLADAMDTVISQQDISRGDAPGGIESGRALAILSENADTPVGRFAKNLGDCWGRAASMVLELFEVFVEERRDATIHEERTGYPEEVKWSGGDLHGHTTVTVPTDAIMPRNRKAAEAFALELYDRQIIQSPEEFTRMADLPDRRDMLHRINPDAAKAMRENQRMASGNPDYAAVVAEIDNHLVHMVQHREFMLTARFENLPHDTQVMFYEHLQAHEQFAADAYAEKVQAAQASPVAAALPAVDPNTPDPEALQQGQMLHDMSPQQTMMNDASAMLGGPPLAPGGPAGPAAGGPPPTGQEAPPPELPGGGGQPLPMPEPTQPSPGVPE